MHMQACVRRKAVMGYMASISQAIVFMAQKVECSTKCEKYTFLDAFFVSLTDVTLMFHYTKQKSFSLLTGPCVISRQR